MRPVPARLIVLLALLAVFALPAAAAEAGTGGASAAEHKDNPTVGAAEHKDNPTVNCAKKRKGKKCQGKNSGPKLGASEGDCPKDASECHVDIEQLQGSPTSGAFCDSFEADGGICLGPSHGTTGWSNPGYFPQYGIQSWFSWTSQGPVRNVEYLTKDNQLTVGAYIRGNVPSPGSATFNVTDAYNRVTDAHWQTVSTGGAPGTKGGPLYIDYEHKLIGSYVHIWGWMVRK